MEAVRDLQRPPLTELGQHLGLHAPGGPELLEHHVRSLRIVLAEQAERVQPVRQLVEDEPFRVLLRVLPGGRFGLTRWGGSVCCHDAQRIAA